MPTPNTPPANPPVAPETTQAAQQVKPPEAQPAGAEAVHADTHAAQAKLRGTIDADIKDFTSRLKSGDFDFADGNNDQGTVENNQHMINLRKLLQGKFAETQRTNNAPDEFQKPWRQAVIQYVLTDVASYSVKGISSLMEAISSMGEAEVDATIQNVMNPETVGRKGQKGVGTFEYWIDHSQLKAEYEKWKANEPKKQEINTKIATAETKMAAIEGIVPQTVKEQLSKLRLDLNADNGSNIASFEAKLTELTATMAKYEELKPLTESTEIPAEKRTEIINKLKAGQITPEAAKQELESAKPANSAEDEEETPTLDKAKSWVESLPKEGTLGHIRGALLKLTTLLTALVSKIAMSDSSSWLSSLLGVSPRGSMVSNEYLYLEHKDAKAELALKTEALFKKFGLPKSIANKFGEKKPGELIAKIRKAPADITSKTELHPKLVALADELEKKGGKGIEATLFTFVGSNPGFADVQAAESIRLAKLREERNKPVATDTPASTPATAPTATTSAPQATPQTPKS